MGYGCYLRDRSDYGEILGFFCDGYLKLFIDYGFVIEDEDGGYGVNRIRFVMFVYLRFRDVYFVYWERGCF